MRTLVDVVSLLDESHFEDPRPELSRDQEVTGLRVVGDAVEHVHAARSFGGRQQVRHVDPRVHHARLRIDARNPILLPDVGVDRAVDVLHLVDAVDGAIAVADAQAADLGERVGVPEAQRVRAVAHDQPLAVVGQSPTLTGVREFLLFREGLPVVDEADAGLIRELDDAVADHGDALAEIAAVQGDLLERSPGAQIHPTQRRLPMQAGAFVELSVSDGQPLREGRRVVRMTADDLVTVPGNGRLGDGRCGASLRRRRRRRSAGHGQR